MSVENKGKRIIPSGKSMLIETSDMHTCGEPLRIITGGLPALQGSSILERRKYFADHYDHIRTALMLEPRGHADMYGAVLTEPLSEGADLGAFFMHNEGYSTMCGHAIIAITKFAIESGLVRKEGQKQVLEIDVPAGRVRSAANVKDGIVDKVSFLNVPSFLLLKDETVEVKGIGRVMFDVAFGGAFYAFCDAGELGLNLDATDYDKLIDYGKKIKLSVIENFRIDHPYEPELGFLYGTIFTGPAYDLDNWSRNVCVFAAGQVDRSPTGTGISARAALHYAKGELPLNRAVTIESILGSTMDVEIMEVVDYGPYSAVIPEVRARAWYTGRHEFRIDSNDPLKEGFIFR
ncbi:MAG: proline racemase family protein [Bacteroidales bacterium]|jgi:trans-L-3-hydroxyproline dehydratase|nr:proline racemase family protein [Bacteroidales bacterium]